MKLNKNQLNVLGTILGAVAGISSVLGVNRLVPGSNPGRPIHLPVKYLITNQCSAIAISSISSIGTSELGSVVDLLKSNLEK